MNFAFKMMSFAALAMRMFTRAEREGHGEAFAECVFRPV